MNKIEIWELILNKNNIYPLRMLLSLFEIHLKTLKHRLKFRMLLFRGYQSEEMIRMHKYAISRSLRYPTAILQHVHRTKATLPVDIAKALYANPSLIQRAIECFYTRDAFQLRVREVSSSG